MGVSWRHLSVLDTILDLIPKPAVCGQEIQCRKQGIVAAVHVPADLQEHGAVYVHRLDLAFRKSAFLRDFGDRSRKPIPSEKHVPLCLVQTIQHILNGTVHLSYLDLFFGVHAGIQSLRKLVQYRREFTAAPFEAVVLA